MDDHYRYRYKMQFVLVDVKRYLCCYKCYSFSVIEPEASSKPLLSEEPSIV